MTDEQAICNLLYLYAELIDRGDFTTMARLFEHAAFHSGNQPPLTDWREVERLYRSLVILYEDGTPKTQHDTTNVWIDMEPGGAAASVRSRFTVLQAVPGTPLQVIVAGRYHDRFEKVAGVWRFRERRMFMDLVGDLTRHLRLDRVADVQSG